MTRLFIFIFLFTFLGCQNRPNEQHTTERVDPAKEIVEEVLIPDTSMHTEGDFFYQFIPVTDSTSRIKWGNQKVTNVSKEVIDNYLLTSKRLYLDWANSKFMWFGRTHFGDTWTNVVLPLKFGEDMRIYNNVMAVERNMGIVVYEFPSEDSILIAENIITSKKQIIGSDWTKCGSAFYHYCIDSISINRNLLYVEWTDVDDRNKKEYKKVKLNL